MSVESPDSSNGEQDFKAGENEFAKLDSSEEPKPEVPDTVSVRRSSGDVEDDWTIGGVDEKTGRVVVVKRDAENNQNLSKQIRLEDLKELNPGLENVVSGGFADLYASEAQKREEASGERADS